MIAYWPLDETAGSSYDDLYDGHTGACAGAAPRRSRARLAARRTLATADGDEACGSHPDFDWGANDSFTVEFWMKRGGPCRRTRSSSAVTTSPAHAALVGRVVGGGRPGQGAFYLVDTDGHGASVLGTGDLSDNHVAPHRSRARCGGGRAPPVRRWAASGLGPAPGIHSLDSTVATLNIGWLNRQGSRGFHYGGR